MHPFKRWLASHASSDALRRELERTSPQFRQYIEATQIGARESTRQTGGFTEMLAEPFQRVSRYRLMIDRECGSRRPFTHMRTLTRLSV